MHCNDSELIIPNFNNSEKFAAYNFDIFETSNYKRLKTINRLKQIKTGAINGQPHAMFLNGILENTIQPDKNECFYWVEQAARKDYEPAILYLLNHVYRINNCNFDNNGYDRYLKIGKELNNPLAILSCCNRITGISSRNLNNNKEFFKKAPQARLAADSGCLEAIEDWFNGMLISWHDKQQLKEVKVMLDNCINSNNPCNLVDMGCKIYTDKYYNIFYKRNDAVKYWQKAADMNNSYGMLFLGLHYALIKDYKTAIKWFNKLNNYEEKTGNYGCLGILGYQYESVADEIFLQLKALGIKGHSNKLDLLTCNQRLQALHKEVIRGNEQETIILAKIYTTGIFACLDQSNPNNYPLLTTFNNLSDISKSKYYLKESNVTLRFKEAPLECYNFDYDSLNALEIADYYIQAAKMKMKK